MTVCEPLEGKTGETKREIIILLGQVTRVDCAYHFTVSIQ